MMVRYASICDTSGCTARSEEFTEWPTCRECGEHVCPAHMAEGTLVEDEGRSECMCASCAAEMNSAREEGN